MLRPRVIVSLLLEKGDLIKTVKFEPSKYVGDPINAVRIFNEKEVDELIVLDIGASCEEREPDYDLIAKLAAECRMPFCYGGGVKNVAQVEKIIASGVEKVALSSAAVENPKLVAAAAEKVGGQSVVAVLDVKKHGSSDRYEVFTHRGQKTTGLEAVAFAQRIERLGAGEIVVNSIDRDGTMEGYDMALARQFKETLGVPLTFLGGAGSLAHICNLIRFFGTVGAAAGSLFVFKGVYRAVLINYPDRAEKDALIASASS
jgi:imidazole glycerol-phosphate synthase subunit HisF